MRDRRGKANLVDMVLIVFFVAVSVAMLYPFWHIIMGSLMGPGEFTRKSVYLVPDRPTLEAYSIVFRLGSILSPLRVSFIVTVVGATVGLFATACLSYGLAKPFPGARLAMYMVVATMFIFPGLIPEYILYKNLGLINTIWVLILPTLITPFFVAIMRNHFIHFPADLEDASRIDGCSTYRTFLVIVLPLSKAVLAAVGLFIAVAYWNTYLPSVYFTTAANRKTLPDYLARIVAEDLLGDLMTTLDPGEAPLYRENVKFANVVLGVLPILLLYPFLQRHFVKGALVGSIKG